MRIVQQLIVGIKKVGTIQYLIISRENARKFSPKPLEALVTIPPHNFNSPVTKTP